MYTYCRTYIYNDGIKLKCITIILTSVPATHLIRTAFHGGFRYNDSEVRLHSEDMFLCLLNSRSWSGNMRVVGSALHITLLSQCRTLDELRFVRAITERWIVGVLATTQPHCRVFLWHKAVGTQTRGFSLVGTITERLQFEGEW